MKLHTTLARILSPLFVFALVLTLAPGAHAATEKVYGENLVFNNGTMDGILAEGETEKTLNADWGVSYPVATFGSATADSPAKIKNIDGNNVLVLEPTSGSFASYFADLSANDEQLPAGKYRLRMDLKAVGDGWTTDNIGYNLYNQYTDVRIYDNGWQNCTDLGNGWLRYEVEYDISAGSVDSIQMWFNTMGSHSLYVDNLSICTVTEREVSEVIPGTSDLSLVGCALALGLSIAGVCVLGRKKSEI